MCLWMSLVPRCTVLAHPTHESHASPELEDAWESWFRRAGFRRRFHRSDFAVSGGGSAVERQLLNVCDEL